MRFGGHNAVKFGVLREVVYKRQDRGAIEQQALALTGVGHIAKLVRGNAQLLGEGLLFYGSTILPFVDHFPKNTELYRIMTTKPQELKKEDE